MAPIPAGSPAVSRFRILPVAGLVLAVASAGGLAAADPASKLVHPEVRLSVGLGPHLQTVNGVDVEEKHSYTIAGGVYADIPANRTVGVVVGVGIPYRFGSSRYSANGMKLDTELLGGMVSGGLSLRVGMIIIEPTLVFSYGHSHASYSKEGYHPNHYGSFKDWTAQVNVLFHEELGVKVGAFIGYDWHKQRLHDDNGDPYEAEARGAVLGFIGGILW